MVTCLLKLCLVSLSRHSNVRKQSTLSPYNAFLFDDVPLIRHLVLYTVVDINIVLRSYYIVLKLTTCFIGAFTAPATRWNILHAQCTNECACASRLFRTCYSNHCLPRSKNCHVCPKSDVYHCCISQVDCHLICQAADFTFEKSVYIFSNSRKLRLTVSPFLPMEKALKPTVMNVQPNPLKTPPRRRKVWRWKKNLNSDKPQTLSVWQVRWLRYYSRHLSLACKEPSHCSVFERLWIQQIIAR